MRPEDIPPGQVREVIDGLPSLLWCRDGSFVRWAAPGTAPGLTIATWAERSGVPHTSRPDPIDLLCEPFLDTQFTAEDDRRTLACLKDLGFSAREVRSLRRRLRDPMCAYNSLVWSWTHLGYTDVVAALGERDVRALGATSAEAWCSSIWLRACQAKTAPAPFRFRSGIGDLLSEAAGPAPVDDSRIDRGQGLKHAVEAAHAEPWRHYHTQHHLAEAWSLGLASLHAQKGTRDDRRALALILAFHDFVYRPGEADNEEASAVAAARWMHEAGIDPSTSNAVTHWIRWSRYHRAEELDSILGRAFFDADMGVLGLSPSRYTEYANGVRQEYTQARPVRTAAASLGQFRSGRVGFLQAVLSEQTQRGRFFFGLHAIHEQAMRDNVSGELARLAD